ncbi:uncharacterized protein THITE_2112887 [Thermothielavioides terrestris NRRL 8126]|uniref:Uncharacterized protein n=1 Tax=Thermothielavioides terrestris (strain ATCC 38088 / NRRL 8126) TaxID=578455 RepID=G2R0Y3_THETT|nr:uncharacterized protein THITE_2112887 [Thermothielavioides terrestris NRRL 8126]AEO65677.1 hypothetical protein THITE_2112887 [Thermothielavioides terrestris NRRL 8126]
MADEPTLPRLPPSLLVNDGRKRGRSMGSPPTHSSSTSSDPAFFSSDDDPALDNYQNHGRRKRRYVGTWYDQQPASSDSGVGEDGSPSYHPPRRSRARSRARPQQQKRQLKRQLDSGVWMGADGCSTDTDDSVDLEPVAARLPLALPRTQGPMQSSAAQPQGWEMEQIVRDKILACVENGTEQVDLSGLDLESIPPGLLDPISEITPIPTVAKDVGFEQRDPQIKLFLSNNRLASFPVGLLNLEHLTVLSLRANNLVKLPPAIAKLRNLETLNIAQNRIRYLPAELLELLQKGSKLRNLHFQPNPLWRPQGVLVDSEGAEEYERLTFGARPEAELELPWSGLTTKLQSRTPVHFADGVRDAAGSTFTIPAPDSDAEPVCPLEPFSQLVVPEALAREVRFQGATSKLINPRGPKTLLELAIGACAASGQADRVVRYLREEDRVPHYLAPVVERAAAIHDEGGLRCAVCGRATLMPLAQWLEFRQIGRTTITVDAAGRNTDCKFVGLGDGDRALLVPFLRVGCSWKCVPARVEQTKGKKVQGQNGDLRVKQ